MRHQEHKDERPMILKFPMSGNSESLSSPLVDPLGCPIADHQELLCQPGKSALCTISSLSDEPVIYSLAEYLQRQSSHSSPELSTIELIEAQYQEFMSQSPDIALLGRRTWDEKKPGDIKAM